MQKLTLDIKYKIGEPVVPTNAKSGDKGYVTGLEVRQGERIIYLVTWSDKKETPHYDFELA